VARRPGLLLSGSGFVYLVTMSLLVAPARVPRREGVRSLQLPQRSPGRTHPIRPTSTVTACVLAASLLIAGCGKTSDSSSTTTTKPAASTSTTQKPGTGKKLVPQATLKKALLTAGEAGSGWSLVASGTDSSTNNPGPSTTKPAKDNGSPSLANVKASKQCKTILANFDTTTTVSKTTASAAFKKADTTSLRQTLVSTTGERPSPTADRKGVSACKSISINTGLARETLALSAYDIPRLGDESLGVKLTVTLTGQGKKVVANAYLAEVLRGNTLNRLVLADGGGGATKVVPVDPSKLGSLAQSADTKLAKAI